MRAWNAFWGVVWLAIAGDMLWTHTGFSVPLCIGVAVLFAFKNLAAAVLD